MGFSNRAEAGRRLAEQLLGMPWETPPVVLAIGPEAVPVAFEVAHAMHAELDILEVRPFRVRGREVGEVASGGVRVVHAVVRDDLGLEDEDVAQAATDVAEQIRRREHEWRRTHPRAELAGAAVVLVADIVGADARLDAAVLVARAMGASRVVAVTGAGLRLPMTQVRDDADAVVCLELIDDEAAVAGAIQGAPPDDAAAFALLRRAEEWRALALA